MKLEAAKKAQMEQKRLAEEQRRAVLAAELRAKEMQEKQKYNYYEKVLLKNVNYKTFNPK